MTAPPQVLPAETEPPLKSGRNRGTTTRSPHHIHVVFPPVYCILMRQMQQLRRLRLGLKRAGRQVQCMQPSLSCRLPSSCATR